MNAGAYGGEIRDALPCARHITPEGERGSSRRNRWTSPTGTAFTVERRTSSPGRTLPFPGNRQEIRTRMEEILSRRKAKQPFGIPQRGEHIQAPGGGLCCPAHR